MRHTLSALAVGATMAAAAAGIAAAEYPERPIQMIVAYNPGGGTDVAARTLAPFIEKYLANDAPITILNKPGAGGEVGFTALATPKPDGYTIGFINTPRPEHHPDRAQDTLLARQLPADRQRRLRSGRLRRLPRRRHQDARRSGGGRQGAARAS